MGGTFSINGNSITDNEDYKSLIEENNRFDNKPSASFFTEITRLEKNKPVPFHDFDIHDDLVMCHQDIVFAMGELNAYSPYISDFTLNSYYLNGKEYFPYFPTFCDKRYLSSCGRIIELLYNYWDKIGDLLSPYFTPHIPENQIFFKKVIENINEEYAENEHFIWLNDFKNNDFIELNDKRKRIVHYSSVEIETLKNYRENASDGALLKMKQEEKEKFPNYFKHHYKMTIDGFYQSMKLIETK